MSMIDNEQRGDEQQVDANRSPPSFWSFLAKKTFLLDEDVERHMPQIRARIRKSVARAYGIGYEWITEPEKCTIEWPASLTQNHRSSRYFWYSHDHLCRGLHSTSVASIKGHPPRNDEDHSSQSHAGIIVEEDNYFERVEHIPERTLCDMMDIPMEGMLPSCHVMEGIYDVIYYGGEYKYFLRHHRTARGTLTLTVVPAPIETQAELDVTSTSSSSVTGKTATNIHQVLQGTVQMDPQMIQDIDIVPYGGNFTFMETDRCQRIVTRKHIHRNNTNSVSEPPIPTAAGVISVKVTQAPTDMLPMRYGGHITPNVFMGELKLMRQDIAVGLLQDCPQPWGESKARDNVTRSSIPTASRSVAECQDLIQRRKTICLLWMRRHLNPTLPSEVIERIDEFVSPPPFFFMQQDDLVLSVDWSGGLPSYSAHSCLIARRRPG